MNNTCPAKEGFSHFDSIADVFNRVWYFSEEYKNFVIRHIRSDLDLCAEDILVDIGGGTGSFTRRLMDESEAAKAYCVEPSAPMCAEAAKVGNITALCMDAHTFMSTKTPFSKLLLKEVIHHIGEREIFWQTVYAQLPEKGRLLIITRPQDIAFPLFSSAKSAFARNQPPYELFESQLKKFGFSVMSAQRSHTFTLSKEHWYDMLRHRFMSDLAIFSDEEIEEGIKEIDANHTGGTLDVIDRLIFITAIK